MAAMTTNFDDRFEEIVRNLRASLDCEAEPTDNFFRDTIHKLVEGNDVRKAVRWRDEEYYESLEGK